VWSRPDDSDSTAPDLIRVSASLEGVDAATAFALFHNMDERASWDTYTQETRVLQQFDPRCQVSYVMYYTNFGISPREFVEYRQTSPIPDGVAMIAKVRLDAMMIVTPTDLFHFFFCVHSRVTIPTRQLDTIALVVKLCIPAMFSVISSTAAVPNAVTWSASFSNRTAKVFRNAWFRR
jgi:hypothetical protein